MLGKLVGRQVTPKNVDALARARQTQSDMKVEPAPHRLVDMLPEIGGRDQVASVSIHPLQQRVDHLAAIVVGSLLAASALPGHSVEFVKEQQDGLLFLSRQVEDGADVATRRAHPAIDDA